MWALSAEVTRLGRVAETRIYFQGYESQIPHSLYNAVFHDRDTYKIMSFLSLIFDLINTQL
jgi:hypothetical protein